jgi:methyltransferase (TIGR00027 family)
MKEQPASAAALATSLIRAVHARCDPQPLLRDDFGDLLLTDADRCGWRARFRQMLSSEQQKVVDELGDSPGALDSAVRLSPAYGAVIVRHRHTEDLLAAAVATGVRQYVVAGAGLDSFAFRHPELARRVHIYEVDQPATQAMKRERLASAGIALPENLHFIACDLSASGLKEKLLAGGLIASEPGFFSLLGVTPYLSRDATLSVLRDLSASTRGHAWLVFDYLEPVALSPQHAAAPVGRMAKERSTSTEPWVSGLNPNTLQQDLARTGWRLAEDLDSAALQERYCARRSDGLTVTEHVHVASAHLME